MLLYKYRGNVGLDNNDFIRDIDMISNNEIWCSKILSLNDPTEASFSLKQFEKNLTLGLKAVSLLKIKKDEQENVDAYKNALENLMKVRYEHSGIYSLSKVYDNALMWAHYGNSHRGFCIEYNFNNLQELDLKYVEENSPLSHQYKFDKVNYSDKIFSLSNINPKNDDLIKFLFNKSKVWSYEEEYRIVTYLNGKFTYNENCLKSIIFGLNMKHEEKEYIINKLCDKEIRFYQMMRKKDEFKFYKEQIL